VYLPKPGVDPHQWAVIAVDQFTSEPEYWDQVEEIVGDAPSTLHLTLPEIYLGSAGESDRIHDIRNTMRQYLRAGILQKREGVILVERKCHGRIRRGLMLCLDLEKYDYRGKSSSLIRATEDTIVERLPSRMKIRDGAALELPHILVLIDDPEHTVIEPIAREKSRLRSLYNFNLMLDGGILAGYGIADEAPVIEALRNLLKPEAFEKKYGIAAEKPGFLYAVGDGNHSLASAKAVWEKVKAQVGPDHPARYALVEVENIHDEGLIFEPIHRVLFEVKSDFHGELEKQFGEHLKWIPVAGSAEMVRMIREHDGPSQSIGIIGGREAFSIAEISGASSNLAVGTIEPFLESFRKAGGAEKIDYIHGDEAVVRLGSQPGNVGIYLPKLKKADLFKTIILEGSLPRKAFSLGEAREKRFYMEARRIF